MATSPSAAATDTRPATPTPSQLPPVPSSPVYSLASTANPLSSYNLPLPPPPRPVHAVLTKADLEQSQTAYADLLQTAKAYRVALASLSTAASAFGSALEACARLKEARAESLTASTQSGAALSASFAAGSRGSCTADLLLSASGVHHLVANHQQILSETVYRDFEVPLLHELDKWRQRVDDEEEAYVREVKARSGEIRKLEKEGLKLHRQRRRDVGKFRAHLVELTTKLDGLTSLHGDHARTLLRESQDTSGRILEASCSLVRAEVDIFESLARKGWSGGGLDDLLEKGADLFASDESTVVAADPLHHHHQHAMLVGGGGGGTGGSAETAKLFSILPPKSILADAASDMTRSGGHVRGDSLLSDTDRYQSLAAMTSPGLGDQQSQQQQQQQQQQYQYQYQYQYQQYPKYDNDTDSIFSETNFNRPRGVRPFSPQPIRRHATDVTFDSLGVGLSEVSQPADDRGVGASVLDDRRNDVLEEEEEEEEGETSEQQRQQQTWVGGENPSGSEQILRIGERGEEEHTGSEEGPAGEDVARLGKGAEERGEEEVQGNMERE